MRENLSEGLKDLLASKGAAFIACADLSNLPRESRHGYPYGVSIGVALDPVIVAEITDGPTKAYEAEYNRVNHLLNTLAGAGAEYLRQQGFEALSTVATVGQRDEQYVKYFVTPLPHKTVATRAGVGWIGKCALLVTKTFGSAVRLTTILTNADLSTTAAVDESQCGECHICVDICPAGALSGKTWQAGMAREMFVDVFACCRTTESWMADRKLGHRICGMCIAACPWTQRYLKRTADFTAEDAE